MCVGVFLKEQHSSIRQSSPLMSALVIVPLYVPDVHVPGCGICTWSQVCCVPECHVRCMCVDEVVIIEVCHLKAFGKLVSFFDCS